MAKHFDCPEEGCAFHVRAADDGQIVAMARKHVRDRHARSIPAGDVEAAIDPGG